MIRSLTYSAVRFTDFVSAPTDRSNKSPGYFQSSAERGLSETDFLGKPLGRFEANQLLQVHQPINQSFILF
jgi:hypothetical protein